VWSSVAARSRTGKGRIGCGGLGGLVFGRRVVASNGSRRLWFGRGFGFGGSSGFVARQGFRRNGERLGRCWLKELLLLLLGVVGRGSRWLGYGRRLAGMGLRSGRGCRRRRERGRGRSEASGIVWEIFTARGLERFGGREEGGGRPALTRDVRLLSLTSSKGRERLRGKRGRDEVRTRGRTRRSWG
jgi:hypothetical protein